MLFFWNYKGWKEETLEWFWEKPGRKLKVSCKIKKPNRNWVFGSSGAYNIVKQLIDFALQYVKLIMKNGGWHLLAQTMVNFRMDEDLKKMGWNRLVKKWDFQWQLPLPCLQPKLAGKKNTIWGFSWSVLFWEQYELFALYCRWYWIWESQTGRARFDRGMLKSMAEINRAALCNGP